MKDKHVARIRNEIDEVLWTFWDPIGVNDTPEARDEYRGYISGIFRLLEAGRDRYAIAEHLMSLETVSMGLGGDRASCERVADLLLKIDRE